ncbi:hypothetical protein LR48_Vigan02g084800 [Vigna angularis]|uniref:Uncharacterized protein n=1 Tax=Phaseolus angularis TaxID=3914 RepID=A0A0L9TVT0_PHAAN|nr:hypothetical protein LR48_Vigan02g084800 [Vigna angularis]
MRDFPPKIRVSDWGKGDDPRHDFRTATLRFGEGELREEVVAACAMWISIRRQPCCWLVVRMIHAAAHGGGSRDVGVAALRFRQGWYARKGVSKAAAISRMEEELTGLMAAALVVDDGCCATVLAMRWLVRSRVHSGDATLGFAAAADGALGFGL